MNPVWTRFQDDSSTTVFSSNSVHRRLDIPSCLYYNISRPRNAAYAAKQTNHKQHQAPLPRTQNPERDESGIHDQNDLL